MTPFIERLVAEGCDTTGKLTAELNRLGRPTLNGERWTQTNVGHYLKARLPALFATVRLQPLRPRGRSTEIKRAFDRVRRQGIRKGRLIAEEFNRQGILPPSGYGIWTAKTVYNLDHHLHRKLGRVRFWTEARIAEAVAFRRGGRSYAEIAWELGNEDRSLSPKAVAWVVQKARRVQNGEESALNFADFWNPTRRRHLKLRPSPR